MRLTCLNCQTENEVKNIKVVENKQAYCIGCEKLILVREIGWLEGIFDTIFSYVLLLSGFIFLPLFLYYVIKLDENYSFIIGITSMIIISISTQKPLDKFFSKYKKYKFCVKK